MKTQLDTLKERGLIAQESHQDKIGAYLEQSSRTFYIGVDPTADSLHIGHLAALLCMHRLVQFGHKAICIVGGGTAVIGDPSDKTEMRKMLSLQDIEDNRRSLEMQARALMSDDSIVFLNNADWLLPLKYLDFMREYGVHFKVNELIKNDIYKNRLDREDGLTVFELNYLLLQSYDYLHLHRAYDCTLQIGGSDQWANILGGVDLIKKTQGKEVYALTIPLVTRSDGKKMGKSESGAVWLDATKTTPYEFYQYWINVPDTDVARFLNVFTFIPTDEIASIVAGDIRLAKKRLAYEVTIYVHGVSATEVAVATSEALFGGGGESLAIPEQILGQEYVEAGMLNVTSMLVAIGGATSKREARDLIAGGGVSIDDVRVTQESYDIRDASAFLVRVGKKHYFKVVLG